MTHKIDEFLQVVGLPTSIDAILDSTGDLKAPPTPHPPLFLYEKYRFHEYP
jgi:hypothetical protein